jgi:hypothetical protein
MSLVGNEELYVVPPQANGLPGVLQKRTTAAEIGALVPPSQFASATNTTGFTATGAQVAGAAFCVLRLTGTLGAGAALTLPLPVDIVAAIPNAVAGQTYMLRIINESSANFAWTVTANGGSTLGGGGVATIAQNTWRDYQVTLTSLTAVVFNNIGTGSWS